MRYTNNLMALLTPQNIGMIVGLVNLIGLLFAIYLYFRNPQIKTDQDTALLREEMAQIKKDFTELKTNQLTLMQNDIKKLSETIQDLSKTVIKLSTIIDERIPRGSAHL